MSPRLALLAGVAVLSTAAILIRLADAPPLAVAAWRLGLATLAFRLAAGPGLLPSLRALDPGARRRLLLAGCALGLHFALWIASIAHTTMFNAVVLIATQPLFAALLSWAWLHERPSARVWFGMLLALSGCLVLAGAARPALGDLLAVGGALLAAAYLTLSRSVGSALPLPRTMLVLHATALVAVVPLAAATGALALPAHALPWVAALALGPSLIGHTLINHAVRSMPSYLVSLAILAEPCMAAVYAIPVFGEVASPRQLAGGAILLGGVALGLGSSGKSPSRTTR